MLLSEAAKTALLWGYKFPSQTRPVGQPIPTCIIHSVQQHCIVSLSYIVIVNVVPFIITLGETMLHLGVDCPAK